MHSIHQIIEIYVCFSIKTEISEKKPLTSVKTLLLSPFYGKNYYIIDY